MPEDRIRKAIRVANFIRWVILTTVIAMTLAGNHLAPGVRTHVILAVMAIYVAVSAWCAREQTAGGQLSLVITTLDVLMVTVLLWMTGGVSSQYYVLYYLPVMYAGVRLSFRDGIGAAVLSAALYLFVAVTEVGSLTPSTIIAGRAGTLCCSSVVLVTFFTMASRQLRHQRRLTQDLHTTVERLSAVYNVGRAAHAGSTEEILDALVCQVTRVSSASRASVALGNADHIRLIATARTDSAAPPPGLDMALVKKAAVSGKAVTSTYRDDAYALNTMCVPLLARGQVLGLLQAWTTSGGGFTQNDADAIAALCVEAAIAVENVRLQEQLAHTAATDYLTQLSNRREFEYTLAEEVRRCQASRGQLAVVMLDVDGFKQCNDIAGHAVGDAVLRAMANAIRDSVGSADLATRYGGDEFAIIMPGADMARATQVTERLRQDFETRTASIEGLPAPVTSSAGITLWHNGQEATDLIRQADRVMYSAKRHGRNCVISDQQADSLSAPGEREEDAAGAEYAHIIQG